LNTNRPSGEPSVAATVKRGLLCFSFLVFFSLTCFSALAQLPKPKWVNDLGGPVGTGSANGRCFVTDLAVDKQNNIFIVADFTGTVDFDPSPAVKNFTSATDGDIFIGKFTQDGALIWGEALGEDLVTPQYGDGSDAEHIILDKDGNITIIGQFSATMDADPGPGVFNIVAPSNVQAAAGAFVIHLDNNGGFLWANVIAYGSVQGYQGLATDSQDDIIVASSFGGPLTLGDSTYIPPVIGFNQYGSCGLIIKYNSAGNIIWSVALFNAESAPSAAEAGFSCTVDQLDNIVVSGKFNYTINFNPLGTAYNLTAIAHNSPFIAKYSPSGVLNWVTAINTSTYFPANESTVTTDNENNVYFATEFEEPITFNDSVTLNLQGINDICFAKYSPLGILQFAKSVGGPDGSGMNPALLVDADKNIYLGGYFSGTINFNPNAGTSVNLFGQSSNMYIAKYNPTGNYIYAFNGGGDPDATYLGVFDLALDHNNNLDVVGQYGSKVNFDPSGCTVDTVTAINLYGDGFMVQYGPSAIATNTIDPPAITSFCLNGTPATITGSLPTGGSGSYTYQWQSAADSINFVNKTGATAQNYPPALLTTTTYFQRIVSSGTCTPPVVSNIVALTITPPPTAPIIAPAATCIGSTARLSVTSPQQGLTYNWYATATGDTSVFTGTNFTTPGLTDTATYYASATNSTGCVCATRTQVTVAILPPLAAPVVTVGPATASTIIFEWVAVPGATGYQASTDNGQTYMPINGLADTVSGLQAGQNVTIIVQATGIVPCQVSAGSAAVTGLALSPTDDVIYVPNVFTPNGDGTNDIAHAHGDNIVNLKFYIYDQWGELIFSSTSVQNGWDGTYKGAREPVGVYVYYLQAVMRDGKNLIKKGSITLIR
jgi:gliding motility-associated-like protein